MSKYQQYQKIGTVEEFEEAKAKQTAKELDIEDETDLYCPECGLFFGTKNEYVAKQKEYHTSPINYCKNCGQKLAELKQSERD